MSQYNVIGIMSGSSLDGVDICHAEFTRVADWSFTIKRTHTLEIPKPIKEELKKSDRLSGYELSLLDVRYAEWIGEEITKFIAKDETIDVIGFHGHTTFHEPLSKLSLQLGKGAIISSITGIPVVDDFRSKDIMAGGQGAPLVPKGEQMLFPEYNAWVNLGGIANITLRKGDKLLAFDIAPCNQVLNFFAQKMGEAYDRNGELARGGKRDQSWITSLQKLPFFKVPPPKSLSNQWVEENILKGLQMDPVDALQSYVTFLSNEIKSCLSGQLSDHSVILFTGGGAHNIYLMETIQKEIENHQLKIVIPTATIVDFKEALIFGFLALLRKLNIPNTIGEATGACRDLISGTLHEP